MRRIALVVLAVFASVLMFAGLTGTAAAKPRNPKEVDVTVQSPDADVRSVLVQISQFSGRLMGIKDGPALHDISAGIPYVWPHARPGRWYDILVTDTAEGVLVHQKLKASADGLVINLPARTKVTYAELQAQLLSTIQQLVAAQSNTVAALTSQEMRVFANATLGNPATLVIGSLHGKQASHTVQAAVGAGKSIKIFSLIYRKDAAPSLHQQNAIVQVGATQFGQTQPTIGSSDLITFSSSGPITVPSGAGIVLDTYTDILTDSTPGTYPSVWDLVGWTAIDEAGSSVPFPGEAIGQSVRIVTGPVLTISTDTNTPPAQLTMMGATGVFLFRFRLSADSIDGERTFGIPLDVQIQNGQLGKPGLIDFRLKDGSAVLAGPVSMTMQSATSGSVRFLLSPAAITLKNSSASLTVEASVATNQSGQAVSGSQYVFSVAVAGVETVAIGIPSATVTVTGSATSNQITIARTTLTVSATTTPGGSTRSRSTVDDLATLSFTAGSSDSARVDGVTLEFQGGTVPSNGSAFTISPIDNSTGSSWGASSQVTASWDSSRNAWVATISPQYTISAGQTKSITVRVNSSSFANAASAMDGLSVTIGRTGDISWYDGEKAFGLDSSVVPLLVVSRNYD